MLRDPAQTAVRLPRISMCPQCPVEADSPLADVSAPTNAPVEQLLEQGLVEMHRLSTLPVAALLREWDDRRSRDTGNFGAFLAALLVRADVLYREQEYRSGFSVRQLYYEFLHERQGVWSIVALFRSAMRSSMQIRNELIGGSQEEIASNCVWMLRRLSEPFYAESRRGR